MPARTHPFHALAALVLFAAPVAHALDTETQKNDAQQVLTELLASEDVEQVMLVVETIGTSADAAWGTSTLLEAKVVSHQDDRVVRRALVALGQLGDASAAEALKDKAGEQDVFIASAAAEGLALLVFQNPAVAAEAASAAQQLAGSESDLVRTIACSILGYLPDHAGTTKLIELLGSDASPDVRRAAAACLSLHADQGNVAEALIKAGDKLRDEPEDVAEMIALALGYVRGEKRADAMSRAITGLSHPGAAARKASIVAVSLLAVPATADEHKGTVNERVGASSGKGADDELRLLEALELRLGILSGKPEDYVDVSKYPVYFPENKVGRLHAQAAVTQVESSLVSENAGLSRMSRGDPAVQAALGALHDLERRSVRVLMEKAHYTANDKVRSAAISGATAEASRRKQGSETKEDILADLTTYAENLEKEASERRSEWDSSRERLLEQFITVMSENDKPWMWVTRVQAAGDLLKALNGR